MNWLGNTVVAYTAATCSHDPAEIQPYLYAALAAGRKCAFEIVLALWLKWVAVFAFLLRALYLNIWYNHPVNMSTSCYEVLASYNYTSNSLCKVIENEHRQ